MRRTNISDGKADDLLLLALRQVQQHGNGQPREGSEEEGGEKLHPVYRIFIILARLPRYRYSAKSSGFEVSSIV